MTPPRRSGSSSPGVRRPVQTGSRPRAASKRSDTTRCCCRHGVHAVAPSRRWQRRLRRRPRCGSAPGCSRPRSGPAAVVRETAALQSRRTAGSSWASGQAGRTPPASADARAGVGLGRRPDRPARRHGHGAHAGVAGAGVAVAAVGRRMLGAPHHADTVALALPPDASVEQVDQVADLARAGGDEPELALQMSGVGGRLVATSPGRASTRRPARRGRRPRGRPRRDGRHASRAAAPDRRLLRLRRRRARRAVRARPAGAGHGVRCASSGHSVPTGRPGRRHRRRPHGCSCRRPSGPPGRGGSDEHDPERARRRRLAGDAASGAASVEGRAGRAGRRDLRGGAVAAGALVGGANAWAATGTSTPSATVVTGARRRVTARRVPVRAVPRTPSSPATRPRR